MKHFKYLPAMVLMLLVGAPNQASAQLFDLALRINLINYDGEDSDRSVDATIGTGLNNASGKTNVLALSYEQESEKLSFSLRGAYLLSGVDEPTLGVGVGYPIKKGDSAIFSFQSGLGWAGFDAGTVSINSFMIPIGIGAQTAVDSGEADITLWGLPYLGVGIASGGGTTNTSTSLGLSFGVVIDLGKYAFHGEGDIVDQDFGNPVYGSIGASWRLGR